jgi:DNA-binding protein H-NS
MMPSPSLKGMNVEALMSLRDQVEKRLLECRAEIEKQLVTLHGQPKGNSARSSLKGKKVPPKYRSPSGETWAGRGARPRWMVEGSEKGEEDGEFFD